MLSLRLAFFILISLFAGNAQVDVIHVAYTGRGTRQSELPTARATSMGRLPVFSLGPLSPDEQRRLSAVGMEQRAGVRRKLPDDAIDGGTWSTLADGRGVWRLEIRSVDATGMRVEFSDFSVGDGKVWVNSDDSTDGPYIGKGPHGDGEFWSGTVGGESALVEYEVAPGGKVGGPPPFRILHVAHQEIRPGNRAPEPRIALNFRPLTLAP